MMETINEVRIIAAAGKACPVIFLYA